MPNTLIPIQTYTLSSTASSVTFSNIPQNYTDLKVVVSARGTATSTERVSDITLRINNDSSASYSYRGLTGVPGSSSTSTFAFTGSSSFQYLGFGTSSDATANTFGSTEFNFVNYTSSVGKSISVDTVAENNSSTTLLRFISGLWSPSTQAAISTLAFSLNSGNFDTGSTFTLYGISNGVKATGGTLTVAGGYAYHTFTSTGSFLPSQQIKGADFLVIGGGGGGGSTISSTPSPGGGGAGGYRTSFGTSGANSGAENKINLIAGNSYTVLIGAGGSVNTNGADSVFFNITSVGGGKGGTANSGSGGNGGSGGGRGGGGSSVGPGTGTALQGFNGNVSWGNSGGGGGGASSGAQGGGNQASINGGGGLTSPIDGVARAGGGGGGGNTGEGFGVATAGGGNGTNSGTAAGSGTANTGGGGGGGGGSGSNGSSGSGGSGIVIIRYPI